MKSGRIHRSRLALSAGLVLACSFGASAALAGPVYVFLVVDPATTAGAGVANSGDFSVTSNYSGPGTWHLYAVDDLPDSDGIRSFNVKLNPGQDGTVPTISNRSPNTSWDDDPTFGSGNGSITAGFSDIRRGANLSISGGQGVVNKTDIRGLGISASNFQLSTPGQSFSATTSGQWGTYADPFTSGFLGNTGEMRNALFVGEGTYTGGAPTVDLTTPVSRGGTGFNYWEAGLTRSASVLQLSSSNPFACSDCAGGNDPNLVTTKWSATPEPPPPVATLPTPPPPPGVTVVVTDPSPTTTPPPEEQPDATLPPDSVVETPTTIWTDIDSSEWQFSPPRWTIVYDHLGQVPSIIVDFDAPAGSVLPGAIDYYPYMTLNQESSPVVHALLGDESSAIRVQNDAYDDATDGSLASVQSSSNFVAARPTSMGNFEYLFKTAGQSSNGGQVSNENLTPEPATAVMALAVLATCVEVLARRRRAAFRRA